ncbi:Uncharacterised protein [Mycobacterium tuberculosis]|nr:Uncharacterised protein [Mycobacterium tuberculosis]CKR17783.1 Uncharacterised protein [Mycobacterium tuberculosis]CKV05898.1 Uncharacterised protein [Mycobacterium tuberculosis]CKW41261.1 Uncharacterised protein [Mycobacterium tuberculosis]CNV64247.1 Uncharacterised protein [Mycobacterium tuberculosis]
MQISVQPGIGADGSGAIHGNIGGGLSAAWRGVKSISGRCAMGPSAVRPLTLIGKPGPRPSGFSRCASPSGGGGPVIGGKSTGNTPVA